MAEVPKQVSDYMAKIGSRGGQKQVAKGFAALTPEKRAENSKKAARTRWAKKAAAKKAAGKKKGKK